ncbi:MAG: hypothetical protein OXR62_02190 [Ahrensia sp.]|nr:hypothetical protein [Ahrensia sp.]
MDSLALSALVRNHANWVETRQSQIARNIAHVDTPGVNATQVDPFSKVLENARSGKTPGMMLTHANHISATPSNGAVGIQQMETPPVLEREMIALNETRHAHQLNVAIASAFHRMHIMAVKS